MVVSFAFKTKIIGQIIEEDHVSSSSFLLLRTPTTLAQQQQQQCSVICPLIFYLDLLFVLISIVICSSIRFNKYVLKKYNIDFIGRRSRGKQRFPRSNPKCQTTYKLDPPDVRRWDTFWNQQVKLKELTTNMIIRKSRTSTKVVMMIDKKKKSNHVDDKNEDDDTPSTTSRRSKEKKSKMLAKDHNMDHVYLNFFQFLWTFIFVGPASYFLWKKATIILKLRVFFIEKMRWSFFSLLFKKKPMPSCCPEKVVVKLVLEQSQVIYYVGQRRVQKMNEDDDNGEIASFLFPNFPLIDIDGKFRVANYLSVEIDLQSKKMISCTLDDESLNASEALILLWYNTITAQHVKIHAYGNWGVNPSNEMSEIYPYYQRSSVVSVIYNFFGFTTFPTFIDAWKKGGLLSKDWDPTALTDTFKHGVRENICQHSNIKELMKHSELVEFVIETRWIFYSEFSNYSHLFPGINVEGLFSATVLHSLDHELMERNLDDPLWLDVNDPRFGKMAELGRIVRVGFVPKVSGYYFHRFFKDSGHPFFEAVYRRVSEVNKEMADCLETCICR